MAVLLAGLMCVMGRGAARAEEPAPALDIMGCIDALNWNLTREQLLASGRLGNADPQALGPYEAYVSNYLSIGGYLGGMVYIFSDECLAMAIGVFSSEQEAPEDVAAFVGSLRERYGEPTAISEDALVSLLATVDSSIAARINTMDVTGWTLADGTLAAVLSEIGGCDLCFVYANPERAVAGL